MSKKCGFLCSSLGTKYLMALTGIGLVGFVIVHLSGHFLIYAGAETINAYAQKLQDLGALLWVARFGLLGIFCLHLACAIKLQRENKAARPVPYTRSGVIQASYASLTMIYSGLFILAFIIYHLAHFTFHLLDVREVGVDSLGQKDVYTMIVRSFENPVVSATYIFAMLVLGLHLSHGISSVFQTLGAGKIGIWPKISIAGRTLAWILALAYISVPVAVLLGLV